MLSYVDVEGYLSSYLTAKNFSPMPIFTPGPGTDADVQDIGPNSLVILSLTGGPGLDSEQVFDRATVQVRAIGQQQDYTSAEQLAQVVDNAMVAVDTSQFINRKWTLSVLRIGGPPSLLIKDAADRYHFTSNYIWEVTY